MRHFLLALVLGLIMAMVLTVPVLADTGTVRTRSAFIWVRSGPGTTYPIVGRLANGTQVTIHAAVPGQAVYADNATWYRIGQGRYVYSGLVQVDPSSGSGTAPAPAMGSGEKWIEIILSQQRLIAREGNRVVMNTLISSGKPRWPTVKGTFHIYVKYRYAPMRGPGYYIPRVPYTMYFYRGYAIHGAYWHNNFGRPMSHGCINMRVAEAAWLFNWAPVGTRVYIH